MELIQHHLALLNPGTDGVPQGPGLLMNFLQHKVGIAAPLCIRKLPCDLLRVFRDRVPLGVVKCHLVSGENGHVAVVQIRHLAGIF